MHSAQKSAKRRSNNNNSNNYSTIQLKTISGHMLVCLVEWSLYIYLCKLPSTDKVTGNRGQWRSEIFSVLGILPSLLSHEQEGLLYCFRLFFFLTTSAPARSRSCLLQLPHASHSSTGRIHNSHQRPYNISVTSINFFSAFLPILVSSLFWTAPFPRKLFPFSSSSIHSPAIYFVQPSVSNVLLKLTDQFQHFRIRGFMHSFSVNTVFL